MVRVMKRWRANLTCLARGTKITVCMQNGQNRFVCQGHVLKSSSDWLYWCGLDEYTRGDLYAQRRNGLSRADYGITWCFGWDTPESKALAVAAALADDGGGQMFYGTGNFMYRYGLASPPVLIVPAPTTSLPLTLVSATSPEPPSTPLTTIDPQAAGRRNTTG